SFVLAEILPESFSNRSLFRDQFPKHGFNPLSQTRIIKVHSKKHGIRKDWSKFPLSALRFSNNNSRKGRLKFCQHRITADLDLFPFIIYSCQIAQPPRDRQR